MSDSPNATLIRAYMTALESGAVGEALASFFTSDAEQIELPNKLHPHGGRSDLSTLLRRAEQGQKLLARQSYGLHSIVEQGDRVAVETSWKAILAVPLGSLAEGQAMSAHFAMFFELRHGRIASQRNYDLFNPW